MWSRTAKINKLSVSVYQSLKWECITGIEWIGSVGLSEEYLTTKCWGSHKLRYHKSAWSLWLVTCPYSQVNMPGIIIFLFKDKALLCSPGWPQTFYVVLNYLMLLPRSPRFWIIGTSLGFKVPFGFLFVVLFFPFETCHPYIVQPGLQPMILLQAPEYWD